MIEILKDNSITYSNLQQQLNICVESCKKDHEIFETLINTKIIDSFEAKQMRQSVLMNKERIERIHFSFNQNYSDKKQMLFIKSSIPVLQLYVAKKRAEEVNNIVSRLI